MSRFERTIGLIGEDGAEKLKNARVLLFGIGGVGGYVAEALIRSGVGRLDAVDGDTVADSNINRQIVALTSTIGRYKAEVFSERAKDINPETEVTAYNLFFNADTAQKFDFSAYNGFFGCRHFSKTNEYLTAHNLPPIDWNLND